MTNQQRDLAFHLAIIEGYMSQETFEIHMKNEKVKEVLAGLTLGQINAVGMEQVYAMDADFARQTRLG